MLLGVAFSTFKPFNFATLQAQNSKKVKELKQQQTKLKTELQNSKAQLDRTRKQVKTGQQNVDFLGVQMNNRLTRIHQLEDELDNLESDIIRLQGNISKLDGEVRMRRERLKAAVRYARAQRENHNPIVFVLSAKTFSQMYRRARYAREYVRYQHNLGEQILQKQAELLDAQNLMLEAKRPRPQRSDAPAKRPQRTASAGTEEGGWTEGTGEQAARQSG